MLWVEYTSAVSGITVVVSPKWERRVGCGAPQCSSLSSRGGAGSKCGL